MSEVTQELIRLQNILPANQATAWLKMATKKNELTQSLQRRELELQGITTNVPDDKISEAITNFKSKFGELKDERLAFTNAINSGIVEPLMAFEKRVDPKIYAPFIALTSRELAIRQKATDKLKADTDLANEIASFKAHFQNEFAALVLEYKQKLYSIIAETYAMCLKTKTPADSVASAIAVAQSAMREVKPGEPSKFTRILIDPSKAGELYSSILKPDYTSILSAALSDLQSRFELYSNDLAYADVAAEQTITEFKATVVEEVKELQQEQAANTLIASAEAFVMPEPGFKSVVEVSKIVIVDDNPDFVLRIATAFIANFQKCFMKLRVKKYSALTIAQMAGALDAAGIKVDGVKYEDICK